MQLAAAVDWPRALQRAGVLMRSMRGDDAGAVQADQDLETQRGAGLQRLLEDQLRRAVGCAAPKPCTCSFCAKGPGST